MGQEKLYIKFERSGGVAGFVRSLEIYGEDLVATEKKKIIDLIRVPDVFKIKKSDQHGNIPDQFQYFLKLQIGDQSLEISMSDSQIPESLVPLIGFLLQKIRG